KNIYRLLNLAQQLHKQAGRRAKTGELNRVIRDAMLANVPPVRLSRNAKVYYAAQVGTHPPTVVLVTNGPELFDDTYVRYLTKVMRDNLPFGEVAIRVILRSKADAAGHGAARDAKDDEIAVGPEAPTPEPPPEPAPRRKRK